MNSALTNGEYDAGDYERANDIFELYITEICSQPIGTLDDLIAQWRMAIAKLYHMGRMDGIRQANEENKADS